MMTRYLEELVCRGKAKVSTLALTGGCSIYKIPQGKHVVITQITAFPFCDLDPDDNFNDFQAVVRRVMHQLRISSKLSSNHFIYRWNINWSFSDDVGSVLFLPISAPVINNVYLTHQDNIFFEWAHNPDPNAYTVLDGIVPMRSNPTPVPLGYGSDVSPTFQKSIAELKFNDVSDSRVHPFGQFTPGGSANTYNQFQYPVNSDTSIQAGNPTLDPSEAYLYRSPLLNVQMVIIDGTPGEHFKPST